MIKIQILRGLMASGKTTYAKDFVKKNQDWKRVCRDDFRHMLSSYSFDDKNERLVTIMVKNAVFACLASGYNLILDETHLNKKTMKSNVDHIKECCKDLDVEFDIEYIDFDIDLQTAILRDAGRCFSVGEKVIKRAWKKYILPNKQHELKETLLKNIITYQESGDIPAIIVDIDGTLAINDGSRSYYSYDENVKKDKCNFMLADMLNDFHMSFQIIIVSGREGNDVCRKATEEWLVDNSIDCDYLYMREVGDNRADTIVKSEIYKNNIKNSFNVACVIDDRKRVIKMWGDLGLFVMDVSQDPYAIVDF